MGRSPEYYEHLKSKKWRRTSNLTIELSGHRCALFVIPKATHCHHMTYDNLGHEWPLFDTVPLSKAAHKLIHNWWLWNTPLRHLVNFYLTAAYFVLIVVAFVLGFVLMPVKLLAWLTK